MKRYFIKKYGKETACLLAVYLTAIGLQILGPELLSRFIDETQSGGSMHAVSLIILGYLIAGMLQKAGMTVKNYWSCDLGNRMTNQLRHEALSRFLKSNMRLHDQWSSREVMTRQLYPAYEQRQYYVETGKYDMLLSGSFCYNKIT